MAKRFVDVYLRYNIKKELTMKCSNTFMFIIKSTLVYYIFFSLLLVFISSDFNNLLFTKWTIDERILFVVSLVTYQICYSVAGNDNSLD